MPNTGFWIQNETSSLINVVTIDKEVTFWLRPKGEDGEVGWIPEKYSDDPIIIRLLNRKTVSKSTDGEVKAKDTAIAEERAIKDAELAALSNVVDTSGNDLVSVPCDAITAKGTRCKNHVIVSVDEQNAGGMHFCMRHEGTDISDYEKSGDAWVVKG